MKILTLPHMVTFKNIWLKLLAEIAIWTVLTGSLIYMIFIKIIQFDHFISFLSVLSIAAIYSASFILLGRYTNTLMDRYYSFSHITDLFWQILFRSIYLIVAFALPTLLVQLLYGKNTLMLDPESPMVWTITGVSLAAVLTGNGVHQLVTFYRRTMQAERAAKNAHIAALRAQIKPHFLFNALNSIASLIRTNPSKAEGVTEDLADLFRYSLQDSYNDMVTLEEELQAVQIYINIEKARFGDRLQYQINLPEHLNTAKLPSFTIQPLAENAVKHGMNMITGVLKLNISVNERDKVIDIIVHDNGPGFERPNQQELYFKYGHGLANVKERIEVAYPGVGRVKIRENAVVLTIVNSKKHGKPDNL